MESQWRKQGLISASVAVNLAKHSHVAAEIWSQLSVKVAADAASPDIPVSQKYLFPSIEC